MIGGIRSDRILLLVMAVVPLTVGVCASPVLHLANQVADNIKEDFPTR